MKLIIAIVSNDDANKVQSELTKNGFSITKDELEHRRMATLSLILSWNL